MKTSKRDVQSVVERNLSPEPESMQKYSDEVRERIAQKAYDLYEHGDDKRGASWKTGSKQRNWSARRWMTPVSERPDPWPSRFVR